ncbi:MAG: hypothetical protein M0R51_15155 [Clostridia bacterium]|jgi:glutamate formiminotransferase|nr:hypothetical protein [Clostridia bacterium]
MNYDDIIKLRNSEYGKKLTEELKSSVDYYAEKAEKKRRQQALDEVNEQEKKEFEAFNKKMDALENIKKRIIAGKNTRD